MKIVHLLTALLLTWVITATAFENQPQTITRSMTFEIPALAESLYLEIEVTIPTSVQNLPIKEQNKIIFQAIYTAYTKAAGKPLMVGQHLTLAASYIARDTNGVIDKQATAMYAFRGINTDICYDWFKTFGYERFFWF